MANGIWSSTQNNPYPQAEFLDATTKRPTRAWQQFFLNLLILALQARLHQDRLLYQLTLLGS